ncbi:3-hydroxyacyl-CoA dehydrogenase NAD-binding domain-containing protein [Sphingomonas sp. RP10(2022)]|uniref:3-hydroxyacyl-CoA dehydrogenase NAD-binding domain-containing protein n=1 Tax=Sphingomonas liriopis TaxID=2949094 RepID=A0A9X2HRU4_9SPHN|nr:3-hydroxyacyl-CoA dehydrogenase NAD-binding domain-containing protein [Sphingomonas liriopis]MCP3734294.1 3-hydroxyacyl-CoA dehydrogenase NAD-binding domain-containing protein [Sphingomonas liriopis]
MPTGTFDTRGTIGLITIDSPPVNALGLGVRQAILHGLAAAEAEASVAAIVLLCAGRTFFAGADITEFGKPPMRPDLLDVIARIEGATKPVIAAIHGTALGGGLETALACDYRIASPTARVGLPEVALGLLPGAGGTQRLPRIVGAAAALEIITGGKPIAAPRALALGIVDRLSAPDDLTDAAIAFAREIVADGAVRRRVRDREDKVAADRGNPALFDDFRARNPGLFRGVRAPTNIVAAIEAAVALPFDEGMAREAALFEELLHSRESEAQRYAFFAERDTAKVPGLPADTPVAPIASVGVIGAGTMGGGIAMNFLNVGLPVTLVETRQDALDRGVATIRRNYEASARKGKLDAAEVERRMALLTGTLALSDLAGCDLVIEAVFESMDLKKTIFAELDAIAKRSAILASNTSFLDLDAIAAVTERPERVVGLHFFSPANVMRLLEVVRGARTAPDVVATAMRLAKRIGKLPVLSGVCEGFIANRAMGVRMAQADALALEGASPQQIDRVLVDYGFPMGAFQMLDLIGLDVIGRDSTERTLMGDLVAQGRLGQKQNGGFYDYDAQRRPTPSPVADEVIAALAAAKGIVRRSFTDQELRERLLYAVVNEGARILDEGIALRASDIDMALIAGYGWPVHTGGPMFWADTVGLPTIVATLEALAQRHGDTFVPSPLLVRLAESGGMLHRAVAASSTPVLEGALHG